MIRNHDCTKGVSTNFIGIDDSSNFVSKWDELVESGKLCNSAPSTALSSPSTPSYSASITNTPSAALSTTTPVRTGVSLVSRGVVSYDKTPPSKRRKFMMDTLDEAIEKAKKGKCDKFYTKILTFGWHIFCTGVMELPTSQLLPPPKETRLLREADTTFISHLKKRMITDPSAPGACPMAVLCISKDNPSEFQEKYKDVYEYEVLGGLHSLLCKNQLAIEYPDNPYYKVALADVYVGLTDEQSLRLARRHNDNSHFVHKVTHRDLVRKKMQLLFFLAVHT